MDIRRLVLFAALAVTAYLLLQAWETDYHLKPETSYSVEKTQGLPDLKQTSSHTESTNSNLALPKKSPETFNGESLINVKTDVIELKIDLNQGEIVQASLLNYPVDMHEKTPIEILSRNSMHQFVAKSQLVYSNSATELKIDNVNYQTTKTNYELFDKDNQLIVQLTGTSDTGLKVVKTFKILRGSYLIDISYNITNTSNKDWKGYLNTQLVQSSPLSSQGGLFKIGTYSGPSYSVPGVHKYKKYSFDSMEKSNLDVKTKGGWIAMQQHYFLVSWIPSENQTSTFYTRAANDNYTIGTLSQPIVVAKDLNIVASSKLYVGPELTSVLKTIAPGLDMTVDYGWFWFISSILFSIMKWIDAYIGNWGWSIIIVTVFIKLCFYRLSASSYRSMSGMKQLQPKIEALKARFGDDKAKLSQATMELYRQEKINPFGGCLPIVIQIPVFIALYWVLIESVELRQAPFILWIHDLSAADPFHVLPVIMGISMLIQQRLNPAPPDPMQAKMMMLLPVVFTGIFWGFPAGLVLYWIVNNFLSILQQWWITRKVEKTTIKNTK